MTALRNQKRINYIKFLVLFAGILHRKSIIHNHDNAIAAGRFVMKYGRLKYDILFVNFKRYTFLDKSEYATTFIMTILYMSQNCKNDECCEKVNFDYFE